MGREFEPLRGHLKIKALPENCEAFLLKIIDENTGVSEGKFNQFVYAKGIYSIFFNQRIERVESLAIETKQDVTEIKIRSETETVHIF